MIDFPVPSAVGQIFVGPNAATWTWDGAKWLPGSGSAGLFLPLAGGSMSGPIVLAADPAAPLQPASKQYVDAKPTGGIGSKG